MRGAKEIETRPRPIKYRGPLLIHAAKKVIPMVKHPEEMSIGMLNMLHYHWTNEMSECGYPAKFLPFGAIIGMVNVVNCYKTEEMPAWMYQSWKINEPVKIPLSMYHASIEYDWMESDLGDFRIGRYAWILKNARELKEPIPWKGSQGFFNVPDDVINAVGFK